MIGGGERAIGSDQHGVADSNAVACVYDGARVDRAVRSDGEITHATGGFNLHEGIDQSSRSNLNQRSAHGWFDVREGRNLGRGMDFQHA